MKRPTEDEVNAILKNIPIPPKQDIKELKKPNPTIDNWGGYKPQYVDYLKMIEELQDRVAILETKLKSQEEDIDEANKKIYDLKHTDSTDWYDY